MQIDSKEVNDSIERNKNVFLKGRAEGDIDLVAICRESLMSSGLVVETQQYFDTNQYIIDAKDLNPEAQRFLLNRYWNLQLLNLYVVNNVHTMEERYCLIDNGNYGDWVDLFRVKILPCLIQHRLPRSIM